MPPFSPYLIALVAVNVLLQIADFVTTFIGFNKGKKEKTPLPLFLMKKFGAVPGLTISKGIAIVILVAVPFLLPLYFAFPVLGAILVFQSRIVYNNIRIIKE